MNPESRAAKVYRWPGPCSPFCGSAFAAPQRREADTASYERIRRTTRRRLSPVLKGLGAAALLVLCALLVYLGAVLLSRWGVWAFFP